MEGCSCCGYDDKLCFQNLSSEKLRTGALWASRTGQCNGFPMANPQFRLEIADLDSGVPRQKCLYKLTFTISLPSDFPCSLEHVQEVM